MGFNRGGGGQGGGIADRIRGYRQMQDMRGRGTMPQRIPQPTPRAGPVGGGMADRFRQQQPQGRMAQPAVMPSGPGGGPQLPMQGRMAQQQAMAQQMRAGAGKPMPAQNLRRPPNPSGNRMPMRGRGRMGGMYR